MQTRAPFLRWQGFEHVEQYKEVRLSVLEVQDQEGNAVPLSPSFDKDTIIYTTEVVNSVNKIAVTPTVLYSRATVNREPESRSGGGRGSTLPNNTHLIRSNGGTISFEGGQLIIPRGAWSRSFYVTIKEISNTDALLLEEKEQLVSRIIEFTKDQQGKFQEEVTLSLQFSTKTIEEEQREEQEDTNPDVHVSDIRGHWAEDSIRQLVGLGAINGYPDGTFKPNNSITRAEFASILVHALKLEEMSLQAETKGAGTFTDQDNISPWAQEAVAILQEQGIMGGYPDGSFQPQREATRAEAAEILVRSLE